MKLPIINLKQYRLGQMTLDLLPYVAAIVCVGIFGVLTARFMHKATVEVDLGREHVEHLRSLGETYRATEAKAKAAMFEQYRR